MQPPGFRSNISLHARCKGVVTGHRPRVLPGASMLQKARHTLGLIQQGSSYERNYMSCYMPPQDNYTKKKSCGI